MNTVTLRRFRSGDESAVSDVICTTLAISNRKDYLPACFGIVSCGSFYRGRFELGGTFAVLTVAQLILALTNYLISKKNK